MPISSIHYQIFGLLTAITKSLSISLERIDWAKLVISTLTLIWPTIFTLIGIWIGSYLSSKNDNKRRQAEFVDRQLRELYAPLWIKRLKIRTLSMIRTQVGNAASAEYNNLYDRVKEAPPQIARTVINRATEAFIEPVTEHDNVQLKDAILPLYEEMLSILEKNCGLAEPETLTWLPKFIGYLQTWDRSKSLHPQILMKVRINEEELMPFYDHIESVFYELQHRQRIGKIGKLNPEKIPNRNSTDEIIRRGIKRPFEEDNAGPTT